MGYSLTSAGKNLQAVRNGKMRGEYAINTKTKPSKQR